MKAKLLLFVLGISIGVVSTAYWHQQFDDNNIKSVELLRVYDGDTFFVNIKDCPDIFGKNIGVRIRGIDTPELRGTEGVEKEIALKAKSKLATLLAYKEIELKNIEREKYFRIICDVYVQDISVADVLLESKLAKPYHGGKKPNWP